MSSAERIAQLEEKWKEDREKISLIRRPIQTLTLFAYAMGELQTNTFFYTISHPVFIYLIVPSTILWIICEFLPGSYTAAIDVIEFVLQYVIWWVGLGILSSIGLGSGLQSGVLFLFPHMMKIVFAAQTCKSLQFEKATEIWFRNSENLFKCPPLTGYEKPVQFHEIWLTVLLPSFLWSAGTAIGEIPPYWISRATRLAALKTGDTHLFSYFTSFHFTTLDLIWICGLSILHPFHPSRVAIHLYMSYS